MVTYLNNEFVSSEKALIHVSDLAVQRGYGIFEFFKVRNGYPLFLDDYFDRFYRSAELMQLEIPLSRAELKNVVYELLNRNNAKDCGIKFTLTGGYSPDAYSIDKPNFIIAQYPLSLAPKMTDGISVITHEHVRELAEVKTINYITGIFTLKKMYEANASDVLYHQNGLISEFPRCNFFIVTKDNEIRTPDKNVLRGITRKNILRIAPSKFKISEGSVTLRDAMEANEAFLTSTTKRIIPITKIDDKEIGDGKPGKVSEELFNALVEFENSEIQRLESENSIHR